MCRGAKEVGRYGALFIYVRPNILVNQFLVAVEHSTGIFKRNEKESYRALCITNSPSVWLTNTDRN